MKHYIKTFLLTVTLTGLLISCATTSTVKSAKSAKKLEYKDYPWSTFNIKAGEEIKVPVDCGFIFYGKTNFSADNWDFSIPKELGNKTLVVSVPYTYYFEGLKEEVFYELIISNINLNSEIASLPLYAEIKQGTVIGVAAADNPGIMFRSVLNREPNLVIDGKHIPLENGTYTYYDASSLMPTTPKFLTFMPVTSKRDEIEFWDYPETLEHINNASLENPDGRDHITRFPFFQIMVKSKLSAYPEQILKNSMNDILLQNQFYPNCTSEFVLDFDGVPFHLMFQQGFDGFLREEYTLNDDIYLYLSFLFGKNGQLYFYVRDYTLESPEEKYERITNIIETRLKETE